MNIESWEPNDPELKKMRPLSTREGPLDERIERRLSRLFTPTDRAALICPWRRGLVDIEWDPIRQDATLRMRSHVAKIVREIVREEES